MINKSTYCLQTAEFVQSVNASRLYGVFYSFDRRMTRHYEHSHQLTIDGCCSLYVHIVSFYISTSLHDTTSFYSRFCVHNMVKKVEFTHMSVGPRADPGVQSARR